MKQFKDVITLVRNNRGCYILDTVKGCSVCAKEKPRGCYGDCYAKSIASRYGMDFDNPVKRDFIQDKQLSLFDFKNSNHLNKIIKDISKIKMPFVRIGEMGDPSEDWEHTINICSVIKPAKKPIVIITKHWKKIPSYILSGLWEFDLYIHTSISALDTEKEIDYRLNEYNKLKRFSNSILRVVTCSFNKNTKDGEIKDKIQNELLKNKSVIETVFRPSKYNPLVTSGIINVKNEIFLKSKVIASKRIEDIYMGMCYNCPDMCGVKEV